MKKLMIVFGATFLPLVAHAQDFGKKLLSDTGVKNGGYQTSSIETILGNVITAFLGLLGVIFLVLMLYGGYMWLIARGNEEKVNTAKDTIKNSIIGLIIVVASYAISYYVLTAVFPSK
jgi:Type IV secretion system pilin